MGGGSYGKGKKRWPVSPGRRGRSGDDSDPVQTDLRHQRRGLCSEPGPRYASLVDAFLDCSFTTGPSDVRKTKNLFVVVLSTGPDPRRH